MYDEEVRQRALALLAQGYSAREVSERMGGKPKHAIILRWASGYTPTAKRRVARLYSAQEKLDAIHRLDEGEHYTIVANDIGCAPSTLLTWRKRYEEQGEEALHTRLDARE